MSPKTFDLNDPIDAREYLLNMEAAGKLTFDGGECVADLSDADVLDAASLIFLRLNKARGGAPQ